MLMFLWECWQRYQGFLGRNPVLGTLIAILAVVVIAGVIFCIFFLPDVLRWQQIRRGEAPDPDPGMEVAQSGYASGLDPSHLRLRQEPYAEGLSSILFLPGILRRRRDRRDRELITEPVQLVKIIYRTGLANPQVWFQREGEKRPLRLETTDALISKFPPVGTRGMLEHQGSILHSFSWEGKTILQENPHAGAKQ